ncbi:uncharacterized protein LOC121996880 [Zingiber officinale]|uniref:uncharacterized protein LOC121996880 n=1 Tax=Zingiber officinale TaxID=94328 RepID=UPI001C4D30BC|nr:uncharacterized protein LOC121996880 [Zingiber officinale]
MAQESFAPWYTSTSSIFDAANRAYLYSRYEIPHTYRICLPSLADRPHLPPDNHVTFFSDQLVAMIAILKSLISKEIILAKGELLTKEPELLNKQGLSSTVPTSETSTSHSTEATISRELPPASPSIPDIVPLEQKVALKKKYKGRKLTLAPSPKRQALSAPEDIALEDEQEPSPKLTLSSLYPILSTSAPIPTQEDSSLPGFGEDDVFTRSGFINWKKAIEKFNEHVGGVGSVYNEARIQFEGFNNQRQSVEYSFSSGKHEIEVAYRKRLTTILKVIRFLLLQGLPFRGRDESLTSSNRGIFLELLKWYSSECPKVVAIVGMNAPENNQMIIPKIQKQLVNACAVETTNVILTDLGDRYVNKHGEVTERFMAVVPVATTTAACLKEAIDSLFAKYGLSVARLRGQGYDGASNIS